jgi:hypothetical protein
MHFLKQFPGYLQVCVLLVDLRSDLPLTNDIAVGSELWLHFPSEATESFRTPNAYTEVQGRFLPNTEL